MQRIAELRSSSFCVVVDSVRETASCPWAGLPVGNPGLPHKYVQLWTHAFNPPARLIWSWLSGNKVYRQLANEVPSIHFPNCLSKTSIAATATRAATRTWLISAWLISAWLISAWLISAWLERKTSMYREPMLQLCICTARLAIISGSSTYCGRGLVKWRCVRVEIGRWVVEW